MEYKGYKAVLEVDEGSEEIHGRVIGINGIVTFHAPTVAAAREEFAKSVDFHLEMLAKHGMPAERPFSGKFLVRIEPDQHRDLAAFATAHSLSLNEAVKVAVGRLLGESPVALDHKQAAAVLEMVVTGEPPAATKPKEKVRRTVVASK